MFEVIYLTFWQPIVGFEVVVCDIRKFTIMIIAHYISRYDTYHDIQLITQLLHTQFIKHSHDL